VAEQSRRHFHTSPTCKNFLLSVNPFHSARSISLTGKPAFPTGKPFPKENRRLATVKRFPSRKSLFTTSTTTSSTEKTLSRQENDFPKTQFIS